MARFTILFAPVLLAGLSACTTLSRDACSSGDWHKIGVQDGRDGRTVDRFNDHAKACELDRSEASRTTYLEGRRQGLAAYCTIVRGYREGALGQTYYGACPSDSASNFMKGYRLGQRIHQLEKSSSDMTDAYLAVSQKLQQSSLSEADRVTLQQEYNRLKAEDARVKQELKTLRAEADAMVAEARKRKN